jgi:flagellar hook-associated protein 2
VNTLSGMVDAINSADIGITAGISTSGGQSSLTLTSHTAGSSGALSVTSAITSSTPQAIGYTDAGFTSSTADSGTIGTTANASDALTGSFTVQVGNGTTENVVIGAAPSSPAANTIYTGSSTSTLAGIATAITQANLGFSAQLNTAGTGLTFTSGTVGSSGALTVSSALVDTSNPTTAGLNYNPSSDINSLTSLGISENNDGSLTFNAATLDGLLNSDYNGVAGFFQGANGWGQSFSNVLTNLGTSSSTGVLSLAQKADSGVESSLNAEISKEQSFISAQQASLTTELNQANQILQQLPSQLDGINELYSAITGFNQTQNG